MPLQSPDKATCENQLFPIEKCMYSNHLYFFTRSSTPGEIEEWCVVGWMLISIPGNIPQFWVKGRDEKERLRKRRNTESFKVLVDYL